LGGWDERKREREKDVTAIDDYCSDMKPMCYVRRSSGFLPINLRPSCPHTPHAYTHHPLTHEKEKVSLVSLVSLNTEGLAKRVLLEG
jgi:hypothetical protein